jgi:ADP-ribose pyrophosphatase YjhB (NUDIX family)
VVDPGGAVELGESIESRCAATVPRGDRLRDRGRAASSEVFERFERRRRRRRALHFVVLDYAATVVGGTLRAGDEAADGRARRSRRPRPLRPSPDSVRQRHPLAMPEVPGRPRADDDEARARSSPGGRRKHDEDRRAPAM